MDISIDAYIDRFKQEHTSGCLTKWMYDHPTATKIVQLAGGVLSAVAAMAGPSGMGWLGGVGMLGSAGSWLFLRYGSCARHDPTVHLYEEKRCKGGNLTYHGDIPVLELRGKKPRQWGYAHGLLLGAEIYALKSNLDLAIHTMMRHPHAEDLPNVLEKVLEHVPPEYLLELRGLSEGFNTWAAQSGAPMRLTVGDVLLIHLITDSKHFSPKDLERRWRDDLREHMHGGTVLGCTSLLDRDDRDRVVFGRNMDWCPFGEAGGKSLLIVWKVKGIAAFGVPGMIGVVTGWNKHNVAMAMNVCPGETTEVNGMPAILFNRHVLEVAESVPRARELMGRIQPLGPYHLTIADPKDGSCFSFYQDQDGAHHRRDLQGREIQVLNWEYPLCEGGYFNSAKREELLTSYFEGAQHIPKRHPKLMEHALQLAPYVNSWITMHSFVFRPGADRVKISWNNGYAASGWWAEVRMSQFFR